MMVFIINSMKRYYQLNNNSCLCFVMTFFHKKTNIARYRPSFLICKFVFIVIFGKAPNLGTPCAVGFFSFACLMILMIQHNLFAEQMTSPRADRLKSE